MRTDWTRQLYLITLAFFALGFFNILFAWLGFACLLTPFVLLFRNRKKTWCQGVCPRANLYQKLFKGRSLTGRGTPAWLATGSAKWIMLGYFCVNLFVLVMSTIMVLKGSRAPLERVRFLLAFQLPWRVPQLLDLGAMPAWVSHLSFRLYSMMFTTTVLGLALGWLYKPRTWCTICPINTVSDLYLSRDRVRVRDQDRDRFAS